MIDTWMQALGDAIRANVWTAPLFALLAGLLTAFTPCSLSTVPLVIGYVGGTAGQDPKRAFRFSLAFATGMAVTLTALGTAASLMGRLMQGTGQWWYLILGVLMVLMALQTWEVITIIPQSGLMAKHPKRGVVGAVLAGMLGGLFASPCATPVLVVLLAIVAERGSLAQGILLLLLYSAGHGALLVAVGTSTGLARRITRSEKFGKYSQLFRWVTGGLILLLGLYMLYLGL